MNRIRQNSHSCLEILTALSLFDTGSVSEARIREYRQFGLRLERDRTGTAPPSDVQKIRAWYRDFMPANIRETAGNITGYLRMVSLIIGILAFLAGTGAAGYLLYYDGTVPVNVLPVLTFFAFLPLLILFFSVGYALLGSRNSGHLPPVFRWIEGPIRSRLRNAARNVKSDPDTHPASRITVTEAWLVHSGPIRYFLKKNLQLAGAAYLTGALLWMLFNVITTDLAFSWSSTLEIRGETLYTITQTISAPWSRIVPGAVVDVETVEATRFYRADRGDFKAVSSGRWWPFIFMTMLVYGFLPKALAFVWYRWQFRKTTDQAVVSCDSGREILGFMEQSLISSRGDEEKNASDPSGSPPAQHFDPSGTCVVLIWGLGDADTSGISGVLNRRILFAQHIGGLNSMEQDRMIITESARISLENSHCDILILVPYWESPTIRLEKKVHVLLGENPLSRIIIIPVIEEKSRNQGASEINWRTRVDEMNRQHGRKRIFLDVHNKLDAKKLTSFA